MFLALCDDLSDVGVKVDTVQCEAGPGQYEVTMDIADGLKVTLILKLSLNNLLSS